MLLNIIKTSDGPSARAFHLAHLVSVNGAPIMLVYGGIRPWEQRYTLLQFLHNLGKPILIPCTLYETNS